PAAAAESRAGRRGLSDSTREPRLSRLSLLRRRRGGGERPVRLLAATFGSARFLPQHAARAGVGGTHTGRLAGDGRVRQAGQHPFRGRPGARRKEGRGGLRQRHFRRRAMKRLTARWRALWRKGQKRAFRTCSTSQRKAPTVSTRFSVPLCTTFGGALFRAGSAGAP